MIDNKTQASEVSIAPESYPAATVPRRPWWKPHGRTLVIFLVAIGSAALLAGLIFGGRDNSGDAAGQGLAGAFEALFFVLGVCLIGSVALTMWLSRYVRVPKIIMSIVGLVALLIVILCW
jgi:hypothetical protein